jgi:hypothetical protein
VQDTIAMMQLRWIPYSTEVARPPFDTSLTLYSLYSHRAQGKTQIFSERRQWTFQRSYRDINGSVATEPPQGGKEMVSHGTLHRVMIITLLGAVLLSMAPALADAIGTSTTVKPVSRTTVIDVPRAGEGREGRERRRTCRYDSAY